MVGTRSQKKMAADSQAGSSHTIKEPARDPHNEIMDKVIERMEALESTWSQDVSSLVKEREAILKLREELVGLRVQHEELKRQYEFTEFQCTRLEERVKEVEE